MKEFNLDGLVRDNIKNLKPYSSARSEFSGEAAVFLDANENSFGSPLNDGKSAFNRYPDPLQTALKKEISKIKGVPSQNTFIGNGSDEIIDIALRIFCKPEIDNVIVCPPTYGMYKVCAGINDIEVREVVLTENFQLDVEGILTATDLNTKLIFICSPNNPTGNNMDRLHIEFLLNNFSGLIIIDEAYINFSRQKTFISELMEHENLLVMQTLSKAWGLASLRLGLGFASEKIMDLFNKVKPPYNINQSSQLLGIKALLNVDEVNRNIKNIVEQRIRLSRQLEQFRFIKMIFPSDSNFILIKVVDADALYDYLLGHKIIVRNRSKEPLCENCLRVTIGTPAENEKLINALQNYE